MCPRKGSWKGSRLIMCPRKGAKAPQEDKPAAKTPQGPVKHRRSPEIKQHSPPSRWSHSPDSLGLTFDHRRHGRRHVDTDCLQQDAGLHATDTTRSSTGLLGAGPGHLPHGSTPRCVCSPPSTAPLTPDTSRRRSASKLRDRWHHHGHRKGSPLARKPNSAPRLDCTSTNGHLRPRRQR